MEFYFSEFYYWSQWVIRLLMLMMVLSRPKRPVVALAWIAITMFVPWLGLVLYLMVGSARLGRRRARRYATQVSLMRSPDRHGRWRPFIYQPKVEESMRPLVGVAESLGGMEILGGNSVEMLPHAATLINRIIADIDAATHHVHMVFFIFEDDEVGRRIGAALARAAQRGVKCRLLADAAGSFFFFSDLSGTLTEQGVEVHANFPVNPFRRAFQRIDLRNHRKLIVIDGKAAFTGSHNIVRGDYGNKRGGVWQDLTARIVGPTVHQLQAVFLDDWCYQTGCDIPAGEYFPSPETPGRVPIQVVPTGPADGLTALMREVIIEALHTARQNVTITTPYFVPDEALTTALRLAAARGARVELVMPRKSDNLLADLAARSYFGQLLEAGVHVYLNKGGMLHAKTMTVDDQFAMLGSANFDIRSFFLNFELNLLLYGKEASTQLRLCQAQYIANAETLERARWGKRRLVFRMIHNAAMLMSPLL